MTTKISDKKVGFAQTLEKKVEDLKVENRRLDKIAQTAFLISDLSRKISAITDLEDLFQLILKKSLSLWCRKRFHILER